MTPEKLARLIELQQVPWPELGAARIEELDALRRELAASPEERADNPETWFVDESRRPLTSGGDWNDTNHALCRDEVTGFLMSLALRYGPTIVDAVVSGLAKR